MEQEIKNGTYTIPEGFTAKIEDGKIIVKKERNDDEDIRLGLKALISNWNYPQELFAPRAKILAYLEKQKVKNQALVEIDNSRENIGFPFNAIVRSTGKRVTIIHGQLSNDAKSWIKFCSDGDANFSVYNPEELLIQRKEQKPTKNDIDAITLSKLLAADKLASAEMTGRLKERNEILENPEKYGLHKYAERSEEDDKIMESLLRHFRKKYKTKPYWNGIAVKDIITYLEKQKNVEIEIEKAYKNVDKIQYEKGFEDGVASVKPAEWNEQDKLHLNNAIFAAEEEYGRKSYTSKWLKSLRPQPHWKPSEEQMDALKNAQYMMSQSGDYYDTTAIIDSLIADLQKLL